MHPLKPLALLAAAAFAICAVSSLHAANQA